MWLPLQCLATYTVPLDNPIGCYTNLGTHSMSYLREFVLPSLVSQAVAVVAGWWTVSHWVGCEVVFCFQLTNWPLGRSDEVSTSWPLGGQVQFPDCAEVAATLKWLQIWRGYHLWLAAFGKGYVALNLITAACATLGLDHGALLGINQVILHELD